MKKIATIKIAAIFTAVIGLTFAFSPVPAVAQEEIMLAMLTKTDSMDEIGTAYKETKVELAATVQEKTSNESIVNRMVQEAGSRIDEAAFSDGWPAKLLGYVPYC